MQGEAVRPVRRDSRGLLFACLFLLVYCVVRLGLHYNATIEDYWVEAPVAGPLPALTVAEPPPLSETALPPSARELCRRTAIGVSQVARIREYWLAEF